MNSLLLERNPIPTLTFFSISTLVFIDISTRYSCIFTLMLPRFSWHSTETLCLNRNDISDDYKVTQYIQKYYLELHHEFYIYCDQRNGVRLCFQQVNCDADPLNGHLYVFINRRKTQMKILYFVQTGFAVWNKRLEHDRKHFRSLTTIPVPVLPSFRQVRTIPHTRRCLAKADSPL